MLQCWQGKQPYRVQRTYTLYRLWNNFNKVKVKVKVLPITGHEGAEGEQRYSPTLSRPRHLDGGGWSAPRLGCFTPGKDPVPIVQEAGWAPEPVWMGSENLSPSGIRSPDRPARSESLYRLSYPGPIINNFNTLNIWHHCLVTGIISPTDFPRYDITNS